MKKLERSSAGPVFLTGRKLAQNIFKANNTLQLSESFNIYAPVSSRCFHSRSFIDISGFHWRCTLL